MVLEISSCGKLDGEKDCLSTEDRRDSKKSGAELNL